MEIGQILPTNNSSFQFESSIDLYARQRQHGLQPSSNVGSRNGGGMRRSLRILVILSFVALLLVGSTLAASAHQPFFEDNDFTASAPGHVEDPTVSTALYATLEAKTDVDYVTFQGKQGQVVLLGLTIPAIAGQEGFTPTLALIGPGLPARSHPDAITVPAKNGAIILRARQGPATTFFEPFSRTSYWERQEERFTLPADGQFIVAVWSDTGQTGRYTLVVGDREVMGGDPAFPLKLRSFWTPVEPAQSQVTSTNHLHCHQQPQ